MSDHRRLQRTLFRMQLDADYARSMFAGDEDARASSGLSAEDYALLRALDPAGVAADPGGRRRAQVLGNAASEYALTVAQAEAERALPGLLEGFASSVELHDALRAERGLPPAFGAYAMRRARAAGERALEALARLEHAMVLARRAPQANPELAPGTVARSPRAHVVELPAGTLALASELRAALDDPAAPDSLAEPGPSAAPIEGNERALLFAAVRASPHRLPELQVELLQPAVAALLERAARPLDAAARAAFAREAGATPAELEAFVDALVADGVLLRA